MANYNFSSLKEEYAEHWHNMVISPERLPIVEQIADKIVSLKDKYLSLEAQTGVPWYFIGIVHLRESNNDFSTHLHNGDPLDARTVHVPAGRPKAGTPPFSFEYSALDALKLKGYDKITDWSIERIAYCLEQYNGFGYRMRGVASPYLWASTNQYGKGKFIADGAKGWRPNVVDTQLGTMAVLKIILNKTQTEVAILKPETTISPAAEAPRPTNKELRKVSKKFNLLEWWQWLTGLGVTGTAGAKALDAANISATKTYVDTIKSFALDYGVVLGIVILIAAFVSISYIMKRQKDDIEEGRYTPSGESNVA